jgi:Ca2+-binding RTX toxin-like protein
MVDPDHETCPKGFANQDDLILGGWGDYWTLRGEWVTWMPMQGTHVHLRGVSPAYHNWGSWNWPTRTLLDCSKVSLAVMSVADAPPVDSGVDMLGKGDDTDRGTAKADDERGGTGDDTLNGGKGDDDLLGGPGADHMYGGPGSDELFDDQGRDVLDGGSGNDRFSTRDGNHDIVECGAGEDIAIGDPHDTFKDCEFVYTSDAGTPAQPPSVG